MSVALNQAPISHLIIDELIKIADERINEIETQLNSDSNDLLRVVRITVKQFRAFWRFLHPAIADELYDHNNITLRDASRSLSTKRDIVAAHNIVEQLLKDLSKDLSDENPAQLIHLKLAAVLAILYQDKHLTVTQINRSEINEAIDVLKASRDAFANLKLAREGWDLLAPGLASTYTKGRKALKEARKEGHDEAFHDWRKSTKYLRFQLQLIAQFSPQDLNKTLKRLKHLAQYLGKVQDYVVLMAKLNADPDRFQGHETIDPVLALLTEQKNHFIKEAVKLGKKVFDDAEEDFLVKTLLSESVSDV